MFVSDFLSGWSRRLCIREDGAWLKWGPFLPVTGESGAVLVEFAVLVPVFFLILFGIIEFAMILTLQNNMMNAARESVRNAAVQGDTPAVALNKACTYLRDYGQTTGQTLNLTFTDSCPVTQNVTVQITAGMKDASVVQYVLSQFTGGNLNASVSMRKELACSVGGSVTTATCKLQ